MRFAPRAAGSAFAAIAFDRRHDPCIPGGMADLLCVALGMVIGCAIVAAALGSAR